MTQQAVRAQLRDAIQALSLRGLRKSANWCAELLQNYAAASSGDASTSSPAPPPPPPPSDAYLVAKCYFDQQEYDRCAHSLSHARQIGDSLELFLWAYATYLAGERRRSEQEESSVNDALPVLLDSLGAFQHRDAFCDWLLGVCLKQHGGREEEARGALVRCVERFPLHWSCWLDLAPLLLASSSSSAASSSVLRDVPDSIAKRFFQVHLLIESHTTSSSSSSDTAKGGGGGEELVNRNTLAFPRSPFQLAQRALFHYEQTDYDTAHAWFDKTMQTDPFRLAGMDCFSNLLFVKEARAELSHLAHQVFKIDRFRPESCIVVGNYYALKRQHERAVVYFQRALLHHHHHTATATGSGDESSTPLILLGHEFIELKNFPAALDTYRRAVERAPGDYRAWYGLGQAYELNRMFYYALHYYQRAKALRPYDPRIWLALGGNYESLGLVRQAIKCFERAEENDDKEGIALIRLAKLYEKAHDAELAARYFERHLARRQQEGLVLAGGRGRRHGGEDDEHEDEHDEDEDDAAASPPKQEDQDALKFLAMHYRDTNRVDLAFAFAENLQRIAGGAHDREIDALLRELQAKRMTARGGGHHPY